MGEIRIGTSGYSYLDWVGPVYPEGMKQDDFVGYYARLFGVVEINFTYYRMPTAGQFTRIMAMAGGGLGFAVKANEALTHKVDPATWREAAGRFLEALGPLREAGRLEAVLLQFPFSFHYDVDRRRYLDTLLGQFAGIPLAVEFRNSNWYNDRVIDAFRKREVALAAMDMPSLKGLPPLMELVTAPLAYVRFHGRNEVNWWGSDAAARYDYRYSTDELLAWADRLALMGEKAEKTLVFFNNHRRGQAADNAKELRDILGLPGPKADSGVAGRAVGGELFIDNGRADDGGDIAGARSDAVAP